MPGFFLFSSDRPTWRFSVLPMQYPALCKSSAMTLCKKESIFADIFSANQRKLVCGDEHLHNPMIAGVSTPAVGSLCNTKKGRYMGPIE
jgi:hypothetical protein